MKGRKQKAISIIVMLALLISTFSFNGNVFAAGVDSARAGGSAALFNVAATGGDALNVTDVTGVDEDGINDNGDKNQVDEIDDADDDIVADSVIEIEESDNLSDPPKVSVSGAVKVSELPDNANVNMLGDVTLTIDKDKTIWGFFGEEYDLTISGTKTLKIRNDEGEANETNEWAYYALRANNIVMNSGTIDAESVCCGIYVREFTMNGGTIKTSGKTMGMRATDINMNDGKLTSIGIGGAKSEYPDSKFITKGIFYFGTMTVNGGTIDVESYGLSTDSRYQNMAADGIESSDHGQFIINGGTVNVLADSGYEIYNYYDLQEYRPYARGIDCIGRDTGIKINGGKLNIKVKALETIGILGRCWGGEYIINGDALSVESENGLDIQILDSVNKNPKTVIYGDIELKGGINVEKDFYYYGGTLKCTDRKIKVEGDVHLGEKNKTTKVIGEFYPTSGNFYSNGSVTVWCSENGQKALSDEKGSTLTLESGAFSAASSDQSLPAIDIKHIYPGENRILVPAYPDGAKIVDGQGIVPADGKTVSALTIYSNRPALEIYNADERFAGDLLETTGGGWPDGERFYQWSVSTDGENWTDIIAANERSFQTFSPQDNGKYFRVYSGVEGYPGGIYSEPCRLKTKYTVSFSLNGHGSNPPASQTVAEGNPAKDPSFSQTSVGKKFDGWYEDKECTKKYTFDKPVEKNTVLYAKWVDVDYTVTYSPSDGGTGTMDGAVQSYGDAYTVKDCEFTPNPGKAFLYWSVTDIGNGVKPGTEITIYRDTTIAARWRQAIVSFDKNGGSGTMNSYTIPSTNTEGTYTLPDCTFTAPENMVFDKWDLGNPGDEVVIKGDTKLKAIWKTKMYTVSFVLQGGGSGTMQSVQVASGSLYTLPECKFTPPTDKVFNKWAYLQDGWHYMPAGSTVKITGNLELSTLWRVSDSVTHTVSFEPNGGSGQMNSITVHHGEQISLPDNAFLAPGHVDGVQDEKYFAYWGSGYAPGYVITVNEDMTFKAIWQPYTFVTVTFRTGGYGEAPESQRIIKGTTAQRPEDPTDPAMNFSGWHALTYDGEPFDFDEPVNWNTFVYGTWEPKEFAATLSVGDNGTAELTSDTAEYGSVVSVLATPDPGYEVDKITYTDPDGETTDITLIKYFQMPAGDVSVNVTFKRLLYNVTNTVNGKGKISISDSYQIPSETVVTIDVTPNSGWKLDKLTYVNYFTGDMYDITNEKFFVMPEANVYVKAVFVEDDTWPFNDVKPTDALAGEIRFAFDKGIISGYGAPDENGQVAFKPANEVRRVQFAIMVYNMAGKPAFNPDEVQTFTDMNEGDSGYEAVLWASSNHIINGFDDGTFKPTKTISRSQIAIMLYKYAEWKGYLAGYEADESNLTGFADYADIKAGARPYLSWAVDVGILSGNTKNKVIPNGNARRDQCAAFFARFYKRYVGE